MPKRDLYRILGVSTQAATGEIKRAYRQIAFAVHPDVGERPDLERFREVHEAYETLINPDRRHSYDVEMSIRRRPLSAEPLRPKAPITVLGDFLTVRPSIEEVLDHIEQNSFGYRQKSGGRQRRLGVEAILDAEEARFGCRVVFDVPCFVRCRSCGGTSEWWGLCPNCYGRGIVESARELMLQIPPGARGGETFEVDLGDAGIANLLLEVRVIVEICDLRADCSLGIEDDSGAMRSHRGACTASGRRTCSLESQLAQLRAARIRLAFAPSRTEGGG
jgi:DnaJ-class molecular chaperone